VVVFDSEVVGDLMDQGGGDFLAQLIEWQGFPAGVRK
jgi:hypothetical protein